MTKDNKPQKSAQVSPDHFANGFITLIASVVVTLLIGGVRFQGGLEWLELVAYDWMMRLRPAPALDSRILVVGITEQDIQDQGGQLQFPDQVYAQLLAKLQAAKPRAIGLDVWRDLPVEPGYTAFVAQLQQSDRIVGITFPGTENSPTIGPPPALPPTQVGFNDVLVDFDGIIRRSLLFQAGDDGETLTSFSLLLAERYLQDNGIEPEPGRNRPEYLQLGAAEFRPITSRTGGYASVDARGYQVLLNYRGGVSAFDRVSLGDVLQGKIAPDRIRDRIVLIGNVAESGKDLFNTPFSAGESDDQRMPGVVVHGQMVSQFLDAALGIRPLLWSWSNLGEGAWIWAWSMFGGILAWRLQNLFRFSIAIVLSVTVLWGICFGIFQRSGWIPLIPPGIGLLVSGGTIVTYRAQRAQLQQQMVMKLLGQNTSPEIAQTLWRRRNELLENGKLPGQKLTATLLFTDLKGFSSISERYAPEELLTWLNDYLELLAQLVQEYQGVINKFTGDGIMAAFGVPLAHERPEEIQQDARNAVDCAIAIGKAIEVLNEQCHAKGRPAVCMRVGIFTGPVVVGSLGSRIRSEYGIIGDSVNTASRLESLDKERQLSPCRILIARQTQKLLPDHYLLESWGTMVVKGKAEPIVVYRVVGKRETNS